MCLSVTLDCISCSAMADWPRWIDDARVDSAAMLSAFEAFCAREPDRSREFQSLFVIVHRSTFAVPPAWTLPSRQCNASNCRRCEAGSGGYQFRWWHQSWEQDYERLSRPGAWKRNEPWWTVGACVFSDRALAKTGCGRGSMCLFWSCSCKDRLWSSSMSLCVFSDRSDEVLARHPRMEVAAVVCLFWPQRWNRQRIGRKCNDSVSGMGRFTQRETLQPGCRCSLEIKQHGCHRAWFDLFLQNVFCSWNCKDGMHSEKIYAVWQWFNQNSIDLMTFRHSSAYIFLNCFWGAVTETKNVAVTWKMLLKCVWLSYDNE